MELKNFRGTFINWESVPTLGEENRYTLANGSRIPQVGDYMLVRDVRDYPHDKGVFYGTETIQSTDESIIGRILAQDVHLLAYDIPSGTLVTYDLFLRLKTVSSPLVVYNSLSWRFILQNVWDAEDFDPQRAYFVDDIVRYGGDKSLEEGTYLKYVGSDDIVWDSTDYVPGKLQWVPYEEVDDSFFSDKALESQVKSNADKVTRALANSSSIYWGDRDLTSQAIEGISVGDSYTLSKQSGEEGLSCKAGDILWLNINNTDTGAFGQLYLIASSDCDVSDTSVSTTVRSIIWSGQKGSVWFSGEGDPSNFTAPGAESGDFYLNTLNGYVYSLVGNVWTYKSTIKGRDGASLESIVEHYLASSLTSGVTVESQGWDSVTELTSVNRNLWNYETITKSNNGSTVTVNTTPRIVGYYSEDGVGVDSITDFYILTDDESHRPSKSDDNWSSTPPTITPALKCLWNYTKIHYTDNSDYESDITLIGRFGDEGQSAYDIAVSHGYQGTEEQWLNTLKGSDGDKWFNSNGVPSDSIGTDGDWCVDTSTGNVYHKVSGHWTSDGNIRGDDGDKWFNGSGAPTSSVPAGAVEGDYYLDTSTGDVYQKKSNGTWGEPVGNIKGPVGPSGSDGVSQYVYIMYSPDPDTNVLHTKDERTDADVWMGICSTTADTAPSNPGSYEWSKVVGDDAGKLRIRGEWNSNTPYFNGYDAGDPGDDTVNPPIPPREAGDFIDVVYVDDPVYTKGTYACTYTHTSGSVFVPTNWSLMTADGTNGTNGESAVFLTLSNENCSVPSNADGSSPILTNAKTTATLYVGGDAVTATYRVSNKSNEITLSQSGNEFTVTALEADTCFADIEATYNDNHYVKRFIVTKQKKGTDGENAISYWIDKSTSIIKERINSDPLDFDPDEVVFTAMKQVGSNTPIRFTTGYLRLWKNGDSVEDDHGTGTLTVTATEGDNYYTVKLYENSETDLALDTETVQILRDGDDGISQYIHIRYAPTDDTSLDDMSTTLRPTDKYLGMSVITSSTPPTRKIDYKWSYFVGEDGTSAVSFRNRGKWKANQTGNNKYVNNDEYIDVVYYETDENSYMCNETHESGATFDSSKWTVLAHKGATGGNGVSEYIHLRYSATDAPHNDMHTPMQSADKYMGVAVNSDKNNPPASPSSYTWSSINAQDGQSVTFNPRDEWTAGAEYVAEDGIIDVVYVDSLGASFACKQSHTAGSNFVYDWETMGYWGILNKNGISVTGTSDEYAANNSEDTPPASDSESWGTFAEAIEDIGPTCRFIWNREIVSYNRTTNPTETLTPHIVYRYTEDGKSLKRIEEQYAYGTASAPSSASDAWGTPVKTPSDTAGQQYVWQRERVIYDTDPETSSDPDWSHATPHILSMYLRGNDGKNSISYWIEKSATIISKDINSGNALTPTSVRVDAKYNENGGNNQYTAGTIKVWKGTDTSGTPDYTSSSGTGYVEFNAESSVSIYTIKLYSNTNVELNAETIPVIATGLDGETVISSSALEFCLLNDGSTPSQDTEWSSTLPDGWYLGKKYWSREKLTLSYEDGSTEIRYGSVAPAVDTNISLESSVRFEASISPFTYDRDLRTVNPTPSIVNLTAEASGFESPLFTWYRDGVALSSGVTTDSIPADTDKFSITYNCKLSYINGGAGRTEYYDVKTFVLKAVDLAVTPQNIHPLRQEFFDLPSDLPSSPYNGIRLIDGDYAVVKFGDTGSPSVVAPIPYKYQNGLWVEANEDEYILKTMRIGLSLAGATGNLYAYNAFFETLKAVSGIFDNIRANNAQFTNTETQSLNADVLKTRNQGIDANTRTAGLGTSKYFRMADALSSISVTPDTKVTLSSTGSINLQSQNRVSTMYTGISKVFRRTMTESGLWRQDEAYSVMNSNIPSNNTITAVSGNYKNTAYSAAIKVPNNTAIAGSVTLPYKHEWTAPFPTHLTVSSGSVSSTDPSKGTIVTAGSISSSAQITTWMDNAYFTGIACNGSTWVATSEGYGMYRSTNSGQTWTKEPNPGFDPTNLTIHGAKRIGYGNGKWVIVGALYGGYSTDGLNWIRVAAISEFRGNVGVWYLNGRWFVSGSTGQGGEPPHTYISTDAVNWTRIYPFSGEDGLSCIAYGNGKWMAAAGGRSGKMAVSTDGITWSAVASHTLNDYPWGLVFFDGYFIITCSYWSQKSTDGSSWSRTGRYGDGFVINGICVVLEYSGRVTARTSISDSADILGSSNGCYALTANGNDVVFVYQEYWCKVSFPNTSFTYDYSKYQNGINILDSRYRSLAVVANDSSWVSSIFTATLNDTQFLNLPSSDIPSSMENTLLMSRSSIGLNLFSSANALIGLLSYSNVTYYTGTLSLGSLINFNSSNIGSLTPAYKFDDIYIGSTRSGQAISFEGSDIDSASLSWTKVGSNAGSNSVSSGITKIIYGGTGQPLSLYVGTTAYTVGIDDLFTALSISFTPSADLAKGVRFDDMYPMNNDVTIGSQGNPVKSVYATSINGDLNGNAATATTASSCSGNAATATTAASCSGNAATATTAASCSGNAATATSATRADNAGDGSMLVIGGHGNEVNFGGTSSGSSIYFGYRAKDSKSVPTDYYFGTSGDARIHSNIEGDINASGTTHKVWGAVFN